MIKGQNLDNIRFGDSFTQDDFAGKKFDYMLANPPFGVEWKPEEDCHPQGARGTGVRRPFRGGPAAHQRRLAAVPPAHDQQDEATRRRAARAWPSSSTVRRCSPGGGVGRERDPPLDHRERLAGGHRRPARPALLQHGHQHLHLDRHQPQAEAPPGQDPAHRRRGLLRQDAEEPRQQAQRDRDGENGSPTRSRRSPGSTASSRRASTSGSSTTTTSATGGSRSSGRCG